MTIKLTTNTYQKFDELENMNVSYGFSHYVLGKDSMDYVRVTKENSLAIRLIEKVSRFIKLDEQQESLNQTLAQAIHWLNQNMNEKVLENVIVQINSPSKLNTFLDYSLKTLKFKQLSRDFFSNETFFIAPSRHITISTNTQGSHPMKTLAQAVGEKKLMLYHLLHEFGHHLENMLDSPTPSSSLAIKALYNRILSLNNDSLKEFNHKYGPDESWTKERKNKFYQKFVIPDSFLINSLAQVMVESYADVAAILLERNIAISQGNFSSQQTIDFIHAIKQFRMDELAHVKKKENKEDFLDMIIYSTHFGHLTYGGLDNLAERLKDYEAKLLDEQTIHRVCEQAAIQNFARTIIALKNTGVLKPRQINCLLATDFHWFDEALVLTEKQSQDFNRLNEELEHCAGYSWCQEYKEKQELINFFLTEKKDDARKESLIISFLTDGKEVDDILKQEINNSYINSYDRQSVVHTIFKPKV